MDMDSQLRGEKVAGYCSDSDNEDDEKGFQAATDENINSGLPMMANTGPKGVLKDYELYKKLQRIEKVENDRKAIELHKKIAFSADPNKHEEEEEEEFDDDDDFLKQYHEKRLAEMKKEMETKMNQRFYKLHELSGEVELLEAIEEQEKLTHLMIVHIYDSISPCVQMNKCLEELVREYPFVKFCKVLAANAGLSLQFKMNALPTLQVYQYGKLIGNFLRVQDKLDREFYPGDVENFLIEAGMLGSSKDVVAAS